MITINEFRNAMEDGAAHRGIAAMEFAEVTQEAIFTSLNNKNNTSEASRRINELKSLRSLRPCIGPDALLRVEGRLENFELSIDTNHSVNLPGRHPLIRLVVLSEHLNACHVGPSYTLMKIRQRFWLIHGVSSVKPRLHLA